MNEINVCPMNEKIYEHTYENGFRLFIWPYTLSEEISLSLTVKYGSIHTKFKLNDIDYEVPNGTAHFLEHVKFNEEKNVTAHDFFTKIGSDVNAYTTYENTTYEVACVDNLRQNLNHLLYFVYNNYFTKELINKEKGIICEEAKSTLDNPYSQGYFKLLNGMYHNNKKKNLVTGTVDDVKSITKEDIQLVFNNFYVPNNMFLVVTGNVNPYEVKKCVDKFWDNTKIHNADTKIIEAKEPNTVVEAESKVSYNAKKDKLFMGYKIPRSKLDKFKNLERNGLLGMIIANNFGATSLLNEELKKNDLIEYLSFDIYFDKDHVMIIFEVGTNYVDEVKERIDKQMNNLQFSKSDFERKLKCKIADSIFGFESAMSGSVTIISNIIRFGEIIEDYSSIRKKLTLQDAKDLMDALDVSNYCSVKVSE